jgi:hypothetical protein
MEKPRVKLFTTVAACILLSATAGGQILVGAKASTMEVYAAKELQRYLYQISGTQLELRRGEEKIRHPSFLLGRPESNPLVGRLVAAGQVPVSGEDPGPEGYVLKKISLGGQPVIVIAGADDVGCLYGVYGLLADHYRIGFFLGGDILPERKAPLAWPEVNERRSPAMHIRGFLPWTNFPQSATVYSWADWKFILDQMAKMRLNFIHIHNYNGELGHNEMYHNFTYKGFISRVWMPTAHTGHKWACPGWDVNQYRFGGADLFDDYDFGAECALHNEKLSNEEVFRKSASLFQRVIEYAHTRGVRVGLGLDIDLIPPEYNARADDPAVIAARVDQLARDYPTLDYLLCFQSENVGKNPEFYKTWRAIFEGFYRGVKARMKNVKVAVSGWGLEPGSIATLPPDVICAPIAYYSDKCESGAIYGDREYWGCPWLERDFNSSEYYYPYNINLSNTVAAYRGRAPNMKGFYCLTWRLTDAIDPKIFYISKAPWDAQDRYTSSTAVYRQYAELAYGGEAAGDITAIIDQNEPYACDFGECQDTPPFSKDQGKFLMNVSRFRLTSSDTSRGVAYSASAYSAQLGIIKAGNDEGGDCIGYINDGDWASYSGVDFGAGASVFEARVASATFGGVIQLVLDSLRGTEIGRCSVDSTGGWQKWVTVKSPVKRTEGRHDLYMVFLLGREISDDSGKAARQLSVIDRWIARTASPGERWRLGLLRCRIAAASAHIELNKHFRDYAWADLPGAIYSWVWNFTHRVTDISSLGNVMSMQNRFIQRNYVAKEEALRVEQPVKAPSMLVARGTRTGALLTWKTEGKTTAGFNVYRDAVKLTQTPLPPAATSFTDETSGTFRYAVTAVDDGGKESPPSVPWTCAAGRSDTSAPFIALISPPTSGSAGQNIPVKVRLLDARVPLALSASILYRRPGQTVWRRKPMARRARTVFAAAIPSAELPESGIEYYIEASDGDNQARFPASAPEMPLSLIIEKGVKKEPPKVPGNVRVSGQTISWTSSGDDVLWYAIYRSARPDAPADPVTYLTYVDASTTKFQDGAGDLEGGKLSGVWYYRVAAVDRAGSESKPSRSLPVTYGE